MCKKIHIIVFFGFVITASEFYYKIKNMQFLWPVRDGLINRLHNCIPEDVYVNLPVITWNVCNKSKIIFFLKKNFFFKITN